MSFERPPENRAPALRVGDADRARTVTRLRSAAGEGRLTFEELSERVERAELARTEDDLRELTADLPAATAMVTPLGQEDELPAARPSRRWLVAIMGGLERRGRWRPAQGTQAIAVMGGIDLDLRQAQITESPLEITAIAVMGGIDVVVPEGVEVEMSGFALMGANEGPKDTGPVPPGAPVVQVRGFSLMGGIDVKRRRRGERR